MAKKSKEFKEFIYSEIRNIGGKENEDIYRKLLEPMSDVQFEEWMDTFIKDDGILNLLVEHKKTGVPVVDVDKNIAIIEKFGKTVFGKLRYEYPDGRIEVQPNPFYFIDAKVKILTQTVEKGLDVSGDFKPNQLTGQSTTAAAKTTMAEMGLLYGMGMTKTIEEFARFRGGDEGLTLALRNQLSLTGEASMENIKHLATDVTSTQTLESLFYSIHMKLFED